MARRRRARRRTRRQRGGFLATAATAAAAVPMFLTGWYAGKKLAIAARNRKARQAYDKMVREIRASDKAHGRGTAIVRTRIPSFEAWKRDNWKLTPNKLGRTLKKLGL